ncbi:hypothetical protein BH10BAC5_BH10BAC5_06470 [soil metagenome]
MLKRLTFLVFVMMLMINVAQSQSLTPQQKTYYKQNTPQEIVISGDSYTTSDVIRKLQSGEFENALRNAPPIKISTAPFTGTYTPESFGFTATFTLEGATSFYSQQSNGTPQQIWQDPNTPDNIHCTFTTNAPAEPSYATRRTAYYFSSDKGATWNYVGDVPTIRSGFGCVNGLSDGRAIISDHNGNDGVRARVYVDAFPGIGAFTEIDPNNGAASQKIWPRIIGTQSISAPIKYLMISSINGGNDSTFITKGTSLNSPTFQGANYQPINSNSAEGYQLAMGSDGRIGIAYISADAPDAANQGDVFFMESTDNGASFTAPQKIYDSNPAADSLGALRGLSINYQGTVPKVAWDICGITATGYYPTRLNKIGFWSPSVNGGNYTILANANPGGNVFAGPRTGPGNVLTPICRISLGSSKDGTCLFATFMAQDTVYGINGTDTTSFSFLYITASGDGGASWNTPKRLTPRTTPAKDWTFASISPTNDNDAINYYVNINASQDDVPFSDVNAPDPNTNTRNTFIRVTIPRPVAVGNIGTEIPATFTLKQNYPNPFNPITNIRFDMPQSANVTLKVYNVSGQEVATLVNNEILSAGVKEVHFDATTFSSGIYFYTLSAGNFTQTKKMMLIK